MDFVDYQKSQKTCFVNFSFCSYYFFCCLQSCVTLCCITSKQSDAHYYKTSSLSSYWRSVFFFFKLKEEKKFHGSYVWCFVDSNTKRTFPHSITHYIITNRILLLYFQDIQFLSYNILS